MSTDQSKTKPTYKEIEPGLWVLDVQTPAEDIVSWSEYSIQQTENDAMLASK